jgi:acetyltransferase-like isoleucine patch superfamily enzyme
MIIFRIKDYLSVLFFRIFCAYKFQFFGKKVRIVYPVRIIGSKFIKFHNNTTLQYNGLLIVVDELNKQPILEIKSGTLIGNFSHIVCSRKITIEQNVLIADKVFISDNSHGYYNIDTPIIKQPLVQLAEVVIGENSWIGENVAISGASIGKSCIIGANSVVTKNINDYTVAVGAPAKPIKRFCFETKKWRNTDSNSNFID